MPVRPTVLERAFELVRAGDYVNVSSLARTLQREGYFDAVAQLSGGAIRKQLKTIAGVTAAAAPEAAATP